MDVVILCGGMGTRLREETEFMPKPMVHIGDRPILWHIMKIYASQGFSNFTLCLGYKGEIIKEYFYNYEILNNDFTISLGSDKDLTVHGDHSEQGWRVTLADTGQNALKGARIRNVERYVRGNTFMLTYGDGLADIDIKGLLEFHRSHGKLATVTGINPGSRFGELKVTGHRVESFSEKARTFEHLVNGGFFVFNRSFFDYLTTDDDCDLEIGPLEKIAKQGELMVYIHAGFWACMDTYRDMVFLNRLWSQGNAPWKIW